jgi:hypothetical protein
MIQISSLLHVILYLTKKYSLQNIIFFSKTVFLHRMGCCRRRPKHPWRPLFGRNHKLESSFDSWDLIDSRLSIARYLRQQACITFKLQEKLLKYQQEIINSSNYNAYEKDK